MGDIPPHAAAASPDRFAQRSCSLAMRMASGQVQLLGFGARGGAQRIDTGTTADLAAQSLTLTGATLGWVHAGVARTAPLP
jgi:hypothetical protein